MWKKYRLDCSSYITSIVMVPTVSVPVMGTRIVLGEDHPDWTVVDPVKPAPLILMVHAGEGETLVLIMIETVLASTNLKSSIVTSFAYTTKAVP